MKSIFGSRYIPLGACDRLSRVALIAIVFFGIIFGFAAFTYFQYEKDMPRAGKAIMSGKLQISTGVSKKQESALVTSLPKTQAQAIEGRKKTECGSIKVQDACHKVEKGDTLSEIAFAYYSNFGFYAVEAIAAENQIEDMNRIYVGELLVVPAVRNNSPVFAKKHSPVVATLQGSQKFKSFPKSSVLSNLSRPRYAPSEEMFAGLDAVRVSTYSMYLNQADSVSNLLAYLQSVHPEVFAKLVLEAPMFAKEKELPRLSALGIQPEKRIETFAVMKETFERHREIIFLTPSNVDELTSEIFPGLLLDSFDEEAQTWKVREEVLVTIRGRKGTVSLPAREFSEKTKLAVQMPDRILVFEPEMLDYSFSAFTDSDKAKKLESREFKSLKEVFPKRESFLARKTKFIVPYAVRIVPMGLLWGTGAAGVALGQGVAMDFIARKLQKNSRIQEQDLRSVVAEQQQQIEALKHEIQTLQQPVFAGNERRQ